MKKKQAKPTANNRLQLSIDYGKVPRTVHTDLMLRGHDEDFMPVPAQWATDALCGSSEKIEVLRARVELGQSLWHPNDNRGQVVHQRITPSLSLRETLVAAVPRTQRKRLD